MKKYNVRIKAFGILLGALFFYSSYNIQAQTIDSTQQKPQLNNELPSAPVPTQPSQRPVRPPETQPAPTPTPTPTDTPPAAPGGYSEVIKNNKADMATKAIEEPQTFVDRLFVGGTGGFNFGSLNSMNYFNLSLSPFIGYRILPIWAVGPGITYEYTGFNGYKLSTYGGKIFTQVAIYKGLLAHLEQEMLSAADLILDPNKQQYTEIRRNISSTLAGGGYRQMNGNFGMDLYVLFNINSGAYQYHDNPVVRVGFIYNLKSRK